MTIKTSNKISDNLCADREQVEMAQKNAALWIQYSSLSIGRSSGTEILDNGGYATVPVSGKGATRDVSNRVNDEMTVEVVS